MNELQEQSLRKMCQRMNWVMVTTCIPDQGPPGGNAKPASGRIEPLAALLPNTTRQEVCSDLRNEL